MIRRPEDVLVWWWVATSWAGAPVVAMGDAGSAASGWVAVLADCLEERAPGQFSVVDRASPGETAATAGRRVDGVRALGAAWIVVSLGSAELADDHLSLAAFRKDLARLLRDLRGAAPQQLLVGFAAPTVAADAKAVAWNAEVAALAASEPGVRHVDLADWPADDAARAALTSTKGAWSEQGHARVAATVCDVMLREKR